MTACVTFSPRWASAVSFIFCRMKPEISLGAYFLPSRPADPGVAIVGFDDLVGDHAHVFLGHGIVEAPPDQPLDREEGVFGVGDALPLGGLADQPFAVAGEGDDGGGGARAFRILDDLGGRALHDRDARIGRAEVDADHFSHVCSFLPGSRTLAFRESAF